MAMRSNSDKIIETPRAATQAENSTNSYDVLKVSMAMSVIAAIGVFWYFGVLAGTDPSAS